jgi:hypothetical protein
MGEGKRSGAVKQEWGRYFFPHFSFKGYTLGRKSSSDPDHLY